MVSTRQDANFVFRDFIDGTMLLIDTAGPAPGKFML